MKRRDFVQLSAAGLATGLFAPAALATPASLNRPALLGWLRDAEEVRRIGRRYLELHPTESSAAGLENAIGRALRSTDIDTHTRDEFARSETVQVNGWILARTEARQCALYALAG
ncbi:MAG: hypothetical protein R2834_08235 [Rhodothermales bacterium]